MAQRCLSPHSFCPKHPHRVHRNGRYGSPPFVIGSYPLGVLFLEKDPLRGVCVDVSFVLFRSFVVIVPSFRLVSLLTVSTRSDTSSTPCVVDVEFGWLGRSAPRHQRLVGYLHRPASALVSSAPFSILVCSILPQTLSLPVTKATTNEVV